MDKRVQQFLADAKMIGLTKAEKEASYVSISSQIDTYSTSFASASKTVALSKDEKSLGKEQLLEFMRAHTKPARKPTLHWLPSLHIGKQFISAAMACIILLTVGGTATYAAEESVPGDLLYPVKVNFTEPMIERFQRGPRGRAEWTEQRIKRRLHEAEQLLSREEVPEDLIEHLQERIELHSAHLEERLQDLPEGVPGEIRSRIEDRLTKHAEFIDAIESGTASPGDIKDMMTGPRGKHRMKVKIWRQKGQLQHPRFDERLEMRQQNELLPLPQERILKNKNGLRPPPVEDLMRRLNSKDVEPTFLEDNLLLQGSALQERLLNNEHKGQMYKPTSNRIYRADEKRQRSNNAPNAIGPRR